MKPPAGWPQGSTSAGCIWVCPPHILGYSTFLSWFIRLFGQSPLVNVGLTTVSGIRIYLLCLRWAGYRAAAFGFFFWSICPSRLLYNSMVMSEPLYSIGLILARLIIEVSGRCKYSLIPMLILIACFSLPHLRLPRFSHP